MEGDIVLKKKKTTNVNKRAPGHVPCVTADCGGISRAISLSDWTCLICSMNGSSTLSPGESVRLNLPKRSMIHASCWGTNLTTCVCVCVSWVTLCGGSAAAAYGVGWQRAGTLSPTRRKTLVPCKHKQMDGRAWATYHRRGTLHRRTAPGGHCSRQQTTTHHTNRRHLRVPHWKIMMVIFPRGPPLSLSLSFLTSPCPHPFVQRWPPSCAGPW